MKKLLIILIVIFAPLWVLAAGNDLPGIPGGFDFPQYVNSFIQWIGTVIFFTGAINRLPWFKFEDQNKRFLSWAVMLITAALSYYFAWGIFDTSIVMAAIYLVGGIFGSHFGYHLIKGVLSDFGVPTK